MKEDLKDGLLPIKQYISIKTTPLLVFSGNKRQCEDFIRRFVKDDRIDCRYIAGPLSVIGLEKPHVIRYGTWYERDDAVDVETELMAVEAYEVDL